MNNQHLWSFDEWHRKFFIENYGRYSIDGVEIDQFGEYLFKTVDPTYDELVEIGSFFDYFIYSPNNLYFCVERQKEYPICSKSRKFNSLEELKLFLIKYKEHYEKLFLYSFIVIPETREYKIRFATFPYNDYDEFD